MSAWVLLPIFFPILAGACLFLPLLRQNVFQRQIYVAAVVVCNAAFVFFVARLGDVSLRVFEITPVISFYFQVDALARFFIVFASLLWIPITVFAFGYIQRADSKAVRYFAFFLMTYGVIIGAALAGNFFTLYLFYELATLLTYPLVIHAGTPAALKAGAKYLIYSFFGAGLAFL